MFKVPEGRKNLRMIQGTHYPTSKNALKLGVELGRKLNQVVLDYAREQGQLHVSVLVAALSYVSELQEERKMAVGDDVLVAQVLMEQNNLGTLVVEPYQESIDNYEAEENRQAAIAAEADGNPANQVAS